LSTHLFDDQRSPSLFEGINARYYRASEIVRSFVPNAQFENLLVRQHSVLVGPRGSGKTTLLRMLHPECLHTWTGPEADKFRSKVEFSGVYVATDKVWRQQADAVSRQLLESEQDKFIERVISLDVMAAMLRTIESRIHHSGKDSATALNESAIAKMVSEIAGAWRLQPKFLDIGSLRIAIRTQRVAAGQQGASPELLRSQFIPWDEAALLAIEAFENASGIRGDLWAMLFDELEIVPSAVRDQILGATRGMDPRLLVKCSLSPWLQDHSLTLDDHQGTVFHDFNVIKLFYGRRAESYEFSRQLISGRLKAAGIDVKSDANVEELVFGQSMFAAEDNEEPGRTKRTAAAYGDTSALGKVVVELADRDEAFKEWLQAHRIDVKNLRALSERKRAQTLRKARNIMVARLEFRVSGGRDVKGRLRSRKTMAMYTGGATMLDICEGNPRLLLGLLVPLLEYFDGTHPIPAHHQADALERIADDFYALLDAIPVAPSAVVPELGDRAMKSPYRELIDRIAAFFQEAALRGRFDPQPPSTFRIPRESSEELQTIIGRLINIGSIVIVPDRGIKDLLIGRFDQNRLRLCYLIAAREHLPPNVDRPVSIMRALSRDLRKETPELPGISSDNS
jgi:energy-coupling factor transporter ATP-binding protein EcfA2